jgi:hypothetical protein
MRKPLLRTNTMKQTFFMLAIFTVIASCTSKSNLDTSKDVMTTDTSALYNSSMLTDTGTIVETNAVPKGNLPAYTKPGATTSRNASSGTSTRATGSSAGSGTASSGSGTGQTTTVRKKGWSKAAKGAVIGAGTGAIAGAIISKKKGKGAIIGGVVGAAGGYIIGRSKDKKDGRVK